MRTLDFAPLYRATVGFDQIADLMDRAIANDVGQNTYPPYNIEKTSDDAWRISIAVAGFSEDDLSIEVKDRGPRGGVMWVPLTEWAERTEQLKLL